jgi:hypothetical protein
MSGAIFPLPNTPLWCDTLLNKKLEDNFTLPYPYFINVESCNPLGIFFFLILLPSLALKFTDTNQIAKILRCIINYNKLHGILFVFL